MRSGIQKEQKENCVLEQQIKYIETCQECINVEISNRTSIIEQSLRCSVMRIFNYYFKSSWTLFFTRLIFGIRTSWKFQILKRQNSLKSVLDSLKRDVEGMKKDNFVLKMENQVMQSKLDDFTREFSLIFCYHTKFLKVHFINAKKAYKYLKSEK